MLCARFFKTLYALDAKILGLIAAAVLVVVSGGSLAMAYLFQYGFGMAPCILCLYQRIPHALAALLGLIALAPVLKKNPKPKITALLVALTAPIYLIGAGIALYHTGVEQHWWASALEACTATVDFSSPATGLMAQIEAAKAVRCDVIPWSLFGISMAGYNTALSLGMAIATPITAILITRRANGF